MQRRKKKNSFHDKNSIPFFLNQFAAWSLVLAPNPAASSSEACRRNPGFFGCTCRSISARFSLGGVTVSENPNLFLLLLLNLSSPKSNYLQVIMFLLYNLFLAFDFSNNSRNLATLKSLSSQSLLF